MGTFVVGTILFTAIAIVIGSMVKNKKRGKSVLCGDDCKHCGGHCCH